MSYTPGPWEFDDDAEIYAGAFAIAQVYACFIPETREANCAANGRLIAAAPELLEACKAFIKGHEPYKIVRDRINAAIEKAEGRS